MCNFNVLVKKKPFNIVNQAVAFFVSSKAKNFNFTLSKKNFELSQYSKAFFIKKICKDHV